MANETKEPKTKSKWGKPLLISILVLGALITPVISVVASAYSSFHPYAKTYYAALAPMTRKLDNTKGKKIVILGTSSITFGINSKLMETELAHAGLDYQVVNYGLYGSLGTKLMMELSKSAISEGDIVLFAPEFYSQTMSGYFSCSETYRSFDSDMSLLFRLDSDDRTSMIEHMYSFASEKYQYQQENKILSGSGVYALSSFDDNMDFTLGERKQNAMDDFYDPDNLIDFASVPFDQDFISYVNDYYSLIKDKKASMYYAFAPVDQLAVKDSSQEAIDSYCNFINQNFTFPMLGNPTNTIYEANYFFDSNFHLNETGMIHHTLSLVDQIKTEFLNTTANITVEPEMPALPNDTPTEDDSLSNTDVDCFTYTLDGDTYEIDGLTDKGKQKESLLIPSSYQGKSITSINKNTFLEATDLVSLTVQSNIKRLRDKMFVNCSKLKAIHLQQDDPTKLAVGFSLLEGVTDVKIYVPASSLSAYYSNYSWSYYMKYLTEEV